MNNLFESYQATKDPLIKQKIILQYQNLVWYVINSNHIKPIGILSRDDYFSFGIEGLNKAIEKFKQELGIKFEIWASIIVYGAIINASKKYLPDKKLKNENLNVLPKAGNEEETYTYQHACHLIEDQTPADDPPPDLIQLNEELKAALAESIKNLPERSQIAIKLYFFDTLTQEEIANLLGVSRRLISHIIDKSLRQLQKDKRLKELWRGEEDRKQP
jgi:RNA polymerase sigma factor for flagellar operon FliA